MLYLKNATHIDWKTLEFTSTHIGVSRDENDPLVFPDEVPPKRSLDPGDVVFDCKNKLVTKSFACGHHHIYSTLARGMPAPVKTPGNFLETLKYIWWSLDKQLDLEMIEASALASALYCAKNGAAFVIDHHSSPFAIENSLGVIQEAFQKVGVRGLLCYEMSDRDGETPKENGLRETKRFLEGGGQGLVGLHASFTVGDDLLKRAVGLAERFDSGIHVHVAEDPVDQDLTLKEHGKRVVERYKDAGVLDFPKTILSHCIHLDENEKRLIRESGAHVVENIESNLNNNVGATSYKELGDNVMLGVDGMHCDMPRSAKAAYFTGQGLEGIDMAGIYSRFRKVNHYIRDNAFSGDGENNLVIMDYDSPTPINTDNFLAHFVYGINAGHVDGVVSSGELIVKNRKLQTMDEEEILSFAREMAEKLWRKLKK